MRGVAGPVGSSIRPELFARLNDHGTQSIAQSIRYESAAPIAKIACPAFVVKTLLHQGYQTQARSQLAALSSLTAATPRRSPRWKQNCSN